MKKKPKQLIHLYELEMSKFVTHVSVFFSDYETYLKKNDLVPRSDVS